MFFACFNFFSRCVFSGIFKSGVALFVFSCVVPIFSHDMGHNDVVSCAVASRVAGERFARFVFVSFSVAVMVVLQFKPIVCSSVVAQVLSRSFFALENLTNESMSCDAANDGRSMGEESAVVIKMITISSTMLRRKIKSGQTRGGNP